MDVGAADAAQVHTHQDLVVANRWDGNIVDPQVADPVEDGRQHTFYPAYASSTARRRFVIAISV